MPAHTSDPLPAGTVDVVVIGGGAAGLNGAPPAGGHRADGRAARHTRSGPALGEQSGALPVLPRLGGTRRAHRRPRHRPASVHHALLFRQLTDNLVYFTRGTGLDASTRARFAARGIAVVDTPVREVATGADGSLSGVVLADGTIVPRRVLAVVTVTWARTDGLDGLNLPMEDLPGAMGRRFAAGLAGATDVPGVWVAGNATDPMAQVGAAAAAGALAGAHINALLADADTVAALSERNS
ncbi:NAD(P)/FAD-dependent oxidoreductase [Nonomuraea sp. NPDC048882]|uniref:NAD(P)/FAD-dependent oxidoreductase n=1 Tax=unclassified Nonomuraea TaxID=2593643 RepID=UPI0033F7611C